MPATAGKAITKDELRINVDGREMRYGPGEWYHVPAQALIPTIEFWFRP
jgi:hypothetical protein